MTVEHDTTIGRYLDFWNAGTPDEQHRLAAATFTDDVRYLAPVGLRTGPKELIDFHDQFIGNVGEARFTSREEPEEHLGHVRLRWRIAARGNDSYAAGTDILILGDDGRITTVVTFVDQFPAGFDHD